MKIYVLGSCRVFRPARWLHRNGPYELVNIEDPWWFSHTARGALQAVRIVLGDLAPPLHLREIVIETDNTRDIDFDGRSKLAKADILIIEVCSPVSLSIGGYEASAPRVARAEKANDPRLNGLVRSKVGSDEILADLMEIEKRAGIPMLLVDHITNTGIPKIEAARLGFSKKLKQAAKLGGYSVFEPGKLVEKHGLDIALADAHHYADEFVPVVAHALEEAILETLPQTVSDDRREPSP